MRTTVDIPDAQRARLLDLAARRGEKGFSGLVQEALELYLRDQQKQEATKRAAGLCGCLSTDEADELEAAAKQIRSRWR
jgi:metal-responsive CopG/Arc/MetJ family transcriptional regulator